MDYAIISILSLLISGLTFFSGFGLGTLLMPVFAIFFPIDIAIAATAVIHLANNLFKVGLVGKQADRRVTLRFAVPAALAAFAGAGSLVHLSALPHLAEYAIGENRFAITPVKAVIAGIILLFACLELLPAFRNLAFSTKLIPIGGIFSGFFGGLSGHQGALRTTFLLRSGLSKTNLVATAVLSAVVVDMARLIIYGATFTTKDLATLKSQGTLGLVITGSLSAFIGSFLGSRLLRTMPLQPLKIFMAVMLILLSIALGAGLV